MKEWGVLCDDAPDNAEKAVLVKRAMTAVEEENPTIAGVLPKEVYGQLVPEEEPELLSKIIRVFKDIPESISIDLFGQIYEFFLGSFALAEGQGGGADEMKFRCYGVEKDPDTVKLAKMNLLLNNVRGEVVEANSFYADPHNAVGRFDYVMANPPFNIDEVVVDRVDKDARFTTYGVPRNKTKKGGKKEARKLETEIAANAKGLFGEGQGGKGGKTLSFLRYGLSVERV